MKKAVVQKQYLISYNSIYGDNELPDLKELVRGISLVPAIETISFLLFRLCTRTRQEVDFHAQTLSQCMMQLPENDKRLVFDFIQKHYIFGNRNILFIDKTGCLNLIQLLLENSDRNCDLFTIDDQSKLFKAILLCNQLTISKQEDFFNLNISSSGEECQDLILPIKIRELEIKRNKDYKVQILKIYYFFEFCLSNSTYTQYLEYFLHTYNLTSYQQYLWQIFDPYQTILLDKEPSPKLEINSDNKAVIDFFNMLTINNRPFETNQDYQILRNYPIYQLNSNTYLLLYLNFFIDKIYQGFLFDFAKVLKAGGQSITGYDKLKSKLGELFSEQVLFYTIMEKCFRNFSNIRFSGKQLKVKLKSGEPDYYIRKGSKIFLFEFKDIIIRADIKYSGDANRIKKALIEKLEEDAQGKKVGVGQIVKYIDEIKKGWFQKQEIDDFNVEQVIIYPIIVHTDISLEAEGVNYFLKNRLNKLIQERALRKYQIKDLVLINLDTLILLQDEFNEGSLKLASCINAYLEYVNREGSVTQMFSFDEFLKYYFRQKGLDFKISKDFINIVNSFNN
jgi:hypothetical protein